LTKNVNASIFDGMNATQLNPKADSRMGRIQKVSAILRAIMLALLVIEGAGALAGVITVPVTLLHRSAFHDHLVFLNCGTFILLPVGFMVTLNFFRLFTRLKDGQLFEGLTVKYLEQAGKWWIAFGILRIIYQALDAYVFTPNKTEITDGGSFFGGLVVFFVAWMLREGQKLKEEQELTV